MRSHSLVVASLMFALVGGCKGKPTDHSRSDDPAAMAASGPNSSSPAANAPAAPSPLPPQVHIPPPLPAAGPPKKTTAPLTAAEYDALTKLEFTDYHAKINQNDSTGVEVMHTTVPHPKLGVRIIASACNDKNCPPMDMAHWGPLKGQLQGAIPQVLRDSPDTTLDMGEVTVDGLKMIYTYTLGMHFTGAQQGDAIGGLVNSYALYYNDGVNTLRVVAAYADDQVATIAQLTKIWTRDRLADVAAQYMSQYLAAW